MIRRHSLAALAILCCTAIAARAQSVPTPSGYLGFQVGADRTLADWTQIVRYFGALAAASPAVELDTLGPTTQGRPFVVATISSPENIRKVESIRRAQALLADPRRLSADEEAALAASQPSVVLISCNIHSTEIGSSQMAMELAYRLATNDTLQGWLKNTVVLLIPSMNPDGEQMVTEWYRQGLGTKWEGGPMPWLYHVYTGHDDNRDWYMVTQQETRLVTDLLYRRWFPEVFYDVHQMGASGARLFVPPFMDPVDPNIDPLIIRGIGEIGAEMGMALEQAGKQGVVDHAIYDVWWDGGARSTPTRHNMIGLLTEAASVRIATPITQGPKDLTGHERGLEEYKQSVFFPDPWPGGVWRLRDIMDYERIASEALVRLASNHRADYVRDFVALGRKQVELGKTEAPYAYVIPTDQRDPGAVAKLVDVLRLGGVEVSRATAPVEADGDAAPAGSYVISLAQPYRAHVKDLVDVQHYPRIEQYPGGPVERPYDVAGWTLPFQMGVRVDSVKVASSVPAGTPMTGATPDATCALVRRDARGRWLLDPRNTASYGVLFRALGSGAVGRTTAAVRAGGQTVSAGTFVIPAAAGARAGLSACDDAPRVAATPRTATVRPRRVAVYKPWTGNMDEGWTRWVLEQFHVPYASLTDSVVKAGKLRDHFDVILVPDMSLREMQEGMSASAVPPRYAGGLGDAGLAELRQFAEQGGTLVLLDHASELATKVLDVPVGLITVQRGTRGSGAAAPDALYAPGSVLRVLVDTTQAIADGMPDTAAVYFTNSVTYSVPARATGVQVIARYPEQPGDILMSGYLQGGDAIAGQAAAVTAPVGHAGGRVVMLGFRAQHRGQSWGTFRMLFNALLDGGGTAVRR